MVTDLERIAALATACTLLESSLRQAVVEAYLAGCSVPAIAGAIGVHKSTIYRRFLVDFAA